jgi:uncharacterized protein (TIGR02453 family)
MLQKTTIDFLKTLKNNNNKEWFDQNRSKYELAKADFTLLVEEVLAFLATIDAGYENLKPKDCLFRLNRDVRFSKNKSPYKTNMGAAFQIGGKKSGRAAFYFHVEPGNHFIGGGLWMPGPDALKKVRQEIDYHFDEFNKIVQQKDFIKVFKQLNQEDALKNPPKGYDAENQAIAFLKLKSFVVGQPLKDTIVTGKDLLPQMKQVFKTMVPFIDFLNRAIAE